MIAAQPSSDALPLAGIRVADFATGIAGPHVGLLLAHHGADVIKIEPPEGDWSRSLGYSIGEFSPFASYYNRGKRSIAIDLKSPQGRELAFDLAASADVVLESFRPGVMKRLGLDHEAVARRRRESIYLSMSGFGQTGPLAQLPATDTVIQGHSGFMSLNRDAAGVPQRFPMIIIDVVSGLFGASAVFAALVGRFRWGRGAYLDCSLLQCALALQAPALVKHEFEKGLPTVMYVPLGVLATKDGHVSISVNRDEHFVAFCRAMELEELASQPEYRTLSGRIANEAALMALIRAEFARRDTAEWIARLQREGILHARIRSYEEVLADPELARRGLVDWLQHADLPHPLPVPNIPAGRRAGDYGLLRDCPRIGQHTEEVLLEAGLPADRIAELISAGAVAGDQHSGEQRQRRRENT